MVYEKLAQVPPLVCVADVTTQAVITTLKFT